MTTNDNADANNTETSSDDIGIVYVLTNPAMEGLVKIGKTTQNDVTVRLSQLYTTGVPLPFDCKYAVKVADMTQVENALHLAFDPHRVNPRREFFKIEADQARAILDLIKIEDVTPRIAQEIENINALDISASDKFKSRSPNLNFSEMDIPIGAVLKFTHKEETLAEVADDRTKVNYQGTDYPISGLTATLLGWSNYVPNSGRYWTYNGRVLQDIHNEIHGLGLRGGTN